MGSTMSYLSFYLLVLILVPDTFGVLNICLLNEGMSKLNHIFSLLVT